MLCDNCKNKYDCKDMIYVNVSLYMLEEVYKKIEGELDGVKFSTNYFCQKYNMEDNNVRN